MKLISPIGMFACLFVLVGCAATPDDVGSAEAELGSSSRWLARRVRRAASRNNVTPLPPAPAVRAPLFDLGQALAFDPILSGNRDIACMTCHHSNLGTDDDRSLSIGVGGTGLGQTRTHPTDARIPRNAPALFNLHAMPAMFWDSRVERDSAGALVTPAGAQLTPQMEAVFEFGVVSAQAMFPVTSREEMRGHHGENELADLADNDFTGMWAGLMARLGAIPAYRTMFEAAYPGTAFNDMTFAHAANAIAGFEIAAFDATDSPFSRLVAGDDRAMGNAEMLGALAFFDAGCASCHDGPSLSDWSHRNTGLAQFGPGKGDGVDGRDDFGRFRETGVDADRYAFRVPTLFNVELTAPYGHDGQTATLRRHVRHYRRARRDLRRYRVARETDDPALVGTQVDNVDAVLAGLDPDVDALSVRGVGLITLFLRSLTDDASRDLSGTVPATVPSGLPVD